MIVLIKQQFVLKNKNCDKVGYEERWFLTQKYYSLLVC